MEERLRQALANNFTHVIDLFRQWDSDGSGDIDRAEFARAMRQLNLTKDRGLSDGLFNQFDGDGSGQITLRDGLRAPATA